MRAVVDPNGLFRFHCERVNSVRSREVLELFSLLRGGRAALPPADDRVCRYTGDLGTSATICGRPRLHTSQTRSFTVSFLIRVQLPDRPGMLGAVATALGSVGADILSVDVVERGTGLAVDDLVVELPSGRLPDVLITAAESVDGVEVDTVRPYAGVLDTHRELELVEEIAAMPNPKQGLNVFAEGVPRIVRAGWALVIGHDGRDIYRMAQSSAAPETRAAKAQVDWFPLKRATIFDGDEDWVPETWRELGTELAATPVGTEDRVLLVGRPGGPAFRAAELARLVHLAGIVAVVLEAEQITLDRRKP
ncbi:ACT domain-containing protein [Pseudonocardiaceae bacterium YIM PH 21723]|nr:ACT domain-containing protein [Pseudonocardiaceae bacterium YIM PH 21723]